VLQDEIKRSYKPKPNRVLQRKAEPEPQQPVQSKRSKPDKDTVTEPKSSETPVTEKSDEVEKPRLKPQSTSKGLSTQKVQIEKHIRQATSSVLATVNPSVPLTLEEKREKLAELKKVGEMPHAKSLAAEKPDL
jgi:hypothetical protein